MQARKPRVRETGQEVIMDQEQEAPRDKVEAWDGDVFDEELGDATRPCESRYANCG